MANRIKGITVEISGNTTKLKNALKGVNGQIKNTQSALKDVERLIKLDPRCNNKERLHQEMELEDQIDKNNEQQMLLVNLMNSGYIEPEVFHSEKNQLWVETDKLSRDKQAISKIINGDLIHLEEAKKLLRFAYKEEIVEKYKNDILLEYVETITVNFRERVFFKMKNIWALRYFKRR